MKYIEYGKEILSRIYELKDGDKEFLSYDEKTIIKLDPKLSIAKNAEKYFKEYKKAFSLENANNIFFTTSALRDYHYTKQKNNAYYHIQAINLPFQNIEFYYIDKEI